MGRGSSVVPGWGSLSVATSVSAPVASGALLGWSSVASGVAPSLVSSVPSGVASAVPSAVASSVSSAVASSVSSGSDGFARPLPVYSVASVTSSVSALFLFRWLLFLLLLLLLSLRLLFLLLLLFPLLSHCVLLVLSPLGGGGGVFADATHGSRLPESDQVGVYSEPLNFPEGEEDTDARSRSEVTGAFRQVLSFIASFFPDALLSESQPPNLGAWFQGFGDERRKEPRVYLSCFDKIKSYASWAIASIFAFLRDTGLSPSDEGFNKVVSSLSVALTAQAKALYVASAFLQQIHRVTYVANLPAHTHDSVKHALLSTPSEESLFSEEVIQRSLGQVRDDSQLQLLKNLSNQRGEKGAASSSFAPTQRRHRSRVLSSLLRHLPGSLLISCGAFVVISARLLHLLLAVIRRNALRSRLPRRWRILANRSYVPRLLW